MDVKQLANENQRIKIVPSFEESLRGIGLNVDLDQTTLEWFTQLLGIWRTWRKSVATDNHFKTFFNLTPDPFRVALILIIKGDDCKDCKPKSLPYYIADELRKWSQKSGVSPDETVKLPAFQIATQQRNQSFLNLMVNLYGLYTIRETIIPIVKDMIKNDNCKQASQIVIAMELFEDIPVEDLLFPLILQDKSNMIDEYLCQSPTQVKPFILFLDRLLDKKLNIREFAQNYVEEKKVCHVKYEKIHSKPLGKLVARLCNKFNTPIETCKNLSKNRTTGGLKYLIHQRYIEHNVSPSVWDDLVKDSLKQNVDSGLDFIDMLIDHDRNEALKWAAYMNIPENDLPVALKDFSLEDYPKENPENWDEEPNCVKEYYKLPLSDNNIVMIDTSEKFYDLMIKHLADHTLVSIDCEWKPSFGAAQSFVALIQIATSDYVFLIDSILLGNKEYTSLWHTFNKTLLDNAEIIKLGFGLEQDLREMKTSIIGLSNIKVKGEGLLDISVLWKSLVSCGLTLPFSGDSNRNSLSCLVQSCFGLPLEKAEQCSNWEIRPLRHTQRIYAALDAYILIEIYNFFQKLCLEQEMNFEEICNNIMLEKKVKCTKKTTSPPSPPLKRVNDLKFILDHSVAHLTPYLRYCGIDVISNKTPLMWHDVIDIAMSEDRYVIINKMRHTPTPKYSQNLIVNVGFTNVKDQLKKIFTYFNICVDPQDILSRCLNCNEENIKKLDANEVIVICNSYQSSKYTNMYENRYAQDDEDDAYRNFVMDSDEEENIVYPPASIANHKTSCLTAKGVPITINNADELLSSCKPAILCDSCGYVFWNEDNICKSVKEPIQVLINFSVH